MKAFVVTATLLAFSASGALAALNDGALTAGKPAGVHQAQLRGGTGMFIVAGAAAIGFAVALATAGDGPGPANPGGGSTTPPATSTTTT
jgi:hypothetical protein